MSPRLLLEAVAVEGREARLLDGITLSAAPGEVLGVAGPNGAGKSTLARVVLGASAPSAGRIRIDGLSPAAFRGRYGIGFLAEDGSRAWERITPRDLLGIGEAEAGPIDDHPLASILRLGPLLDRSIAQLSKGNGAPARPRSRCGSVLGSPSSTSPSRGSIPPRTNACAKRSSGRRPAARPVCSCRTISISSCARRTACSSSPAVGWVT